MTADQQTTLEFLGRAVERLEQQMIGLQTEIDLLKMALAADKDDLKSNRMRDEAWQRLKARLRSTGRSEEEIESIRGTMRAAGLDWEDIGAIK